MTRALIPYYVSRAILSALAGLIVTLGGLPWWVGLLTGLLTFGGFLWYAHSGFHLVDTSTPLTPLRRDERGRAIRDRAVVAAVVVGGLVYGVLSLTELALPLLPAAGAWALLAGVITYFVASNWLYAKR